VKETSCCHWPSTFINDMNYCSYFIQNSESIFLLLVQMRDADSTPLHQQKNRCSSIPVFQYSRQPERVTKKSLKHWSFAVATSILLLDNLLHLLRANVFPFKKQLTLTDYYHSKRYIITLWLIWLPLAVEVVDDMRQASVSQKTDDDSWILCQCLYTRPRCPRSWPQLNTDPLRKL